MWSGVDVLSQIRDAGNAGGARLPPGQRPVDGFPRFGTHLSKPPPAVPLHPVIEVRGAVTEAVRLPLATLATLPRRTYRGDFHCVAGWSAIGLRWEGVPFEAFYRAVIVPRLAPDALVTHLVFRGLDGYRSIVEIDDALADGVLIADHLDGRPLDPDHGAPVRLVSPNQYGHMSTKHLCRIDVHTTEPVTTHESVLTSLLLRSHRRARVWQEERHGLLPGWAIRPVYRAMKAPLLYWCARGSRRRAARRPAVQGSR